MNDQTLKAIQQQLKELARRPRLRKGVVTATGPLTVSVAGGTPYAGVAALDGTTFAVNDLVAVLTTGSDILVLGRIVTG